MTFREYVAKRRITDTPAGDFVADARSDRRMPDVDSWEDLHCYLLFSTHACYEAIRAGRIVWRGYIRSRT